MAISPLSFGRTDGSPDAGLEKVLEEALRRFGPLRTVLLLHTA
jgi:hypothetical protein